MNSVSYSRSFSFISEFLIRINTEAQFTFPMVRIKLIQDSALHIGSHIQGYTVDEVRNEFQ